MTTESETKPDKFYSCDQDYGLELHNTAEQAKERAEETLAMYESEWRAEDDVVEWGRLLPLGRARQVGDGDCELEDQPDELAQLRAERDSATARAAAAELEAPPVVPEGWEVVQRDGGWSLLALSEGEPPHVAAAVYRGSIEVSSYVSGPAAALEALLHAHRTGERPPHADKKDHP